MPTLLSRSWCHARWLLILLATLVAVPAVYAAQSTGHGTDFTQVARQLVARGDVLAQDYEPGQGADVSAAFSSLYFGVFEGSGMEMKLRALDAGRMAHTEARFAAVVDAAMRGQPRAQFDAHWQELRSDLLLAGVALGSDAAPTFAATAVESLLILLREGAEVILVLAALVIYLRRIGAADKLYLVYGGAAAGLALSFATAWVALRLLGSTGGLGALTNGAAMLAAAALLFYLSNWMVGRQQAARRHRYVEGQLRKAVEGGNGIALAGMALLAVYREGAETSLFYVALLAQSGVDAKAVWTGVGAGAITLALGWSAMRKFALRIPFPLLFGATAILLFALSVVFTGRGVFALQLAGWLPSTSIESLPLEPWLGLYPNLQVVGAQLLVTVMGVGWTLRTLARTSSAGRSVSSL